MTIIDIPAQRAGELITPSGVLLSTAEPESDEWFRVRRQGITATDIPKLLGMSKYGNARSVWHDKLGELPSDEAGEPARWGHLLEDVVASEWALRNDAKVAPIGVIAKRDAPWMRAALDRILVGWCPLYGEANCALEVKTRSAYVAGRWRDDMPDDVLAQVAWQRMVSGLDHIHVAALIGGQKMVEHRYDRDVDLEAYLLKEATQLWGQVQSGEVPLVAPSEILSDMLDRLFGDREGDVEDDTGYALNLVEAYERAQALETEAKAAKAAVKAAVLDFLGPAERVLVDGKPAFTYREQKKHSINVTDLENNDVALFEEVLSGGHINESKSRVLRCSYKGETA